jgi:proteasome lid subunit RPN8/RPN11
LDIAGSLDALLNVSDNSSSVNASINECPIQSIEDLVHLQLTQNAYNRAMAVVQTAFEIVGSAVESYWLWLGDEKERIINNIAVPVQHVSHTYVEVSALDLLDLRKELPDEGYSILGWGHSHADFGVFFSGIDWQNQERIFFETSNYARLRNSRIKYCYGSTFNIRSQHFIQLTLQTKSRILQHRLVTIEIIPNLVGEESDLAILKHQLRTKFRFGI